MNLALLVCLAVCLSFPANKTFNASNTHNNVTKSIWKKPSKTLSGFLDIKPAATLMQLKTEETNKAAKKELVPSLIMVNSITAKSVSVDAFISSGENSSTVNSHALHATKTSLDLSQEAIDQNERSQSMLVVVESIPSQIIPGSGTLQDIPVTNSLDLPLPINNPQLIPGSGALQDIPDRTSNTFISTSSSKLVVGLLMSLFVIGAVFLAIIHVKVVSKGSFPNLQLDNSKMAISAPKQCYQVSVVNNESKSKLHG
jgi:hypothetical protein